MPKALKIMKIVEVVINLAIFKKIQNRTHALIGLICAFAN